MLVHFGSDLAGETGRWNFGVGLRDAIALLPLAALRYLHIWIKNGR